ncbi:hypothetical protein ACXET9_07205 [Brachybacterium sp. DNPG3]
MKTSLNRRERRIIRRARRRARIARSTGVLHIHMRQDAGRFAGALARHVAALGVSAEYAGRLFTVMSALQAFGAGRSVQRPSHPLLHNGRKHPNPDRPRHTSSPIRTRRETS